MKELGSEVGNNAVSHRLKRVMADVEKHRLDREEDNEDNRYREEIAAQDESELFVEHFADEIGKKKIDAAAEREGDKPGYKRLAVSECETEQARTDSPDGGPIGLCSFAAFFTPRSHPGRM